MRGPIITDEFKLNAEEMEANNRRIRESYPLWMFDDNYEENALLVRAARKIAAPIAESGIV